MSWCARHSQIHVNGDPYMDRWVLGTPWFEIRLHHILRSDEDRDLHDHPWPFVSLILSGGYWEYRPSREPFCGVNRQWRRPWSIAYRRAEDAHRLKLTRPVWTLVFTGPRRRAWGFYTRRGWVHWRDYVTSRGAE